MSEYEEVAFSVPAGSPLAAEHALLMETRREHRAAGGAGYLEIPLERLEAGKRILEGERVQQARLVAALVEQLRFHDQEIQTLKEACQARGTSEHDDWKRWNASWTPRSQLFSVLQVLLRRKLPLE